MGFAPSARVQVTGVRIDNLSMAEAVEAVDRMLREKRCGYAVTPNVDHLVRLRRDPEFRHIYENAALVLADGMPIVWASRLLGTPLKERVAGSDLFPRVCELAARRGYRLFFLGGRPGAASRAAERLRARHPAIRIVGTYAPPYGFEGDPRENATIAAMVADAHPDVLFVGLGAPKQEKWMARMRPRLEPPVLVGVGAAFDFIAGLKRQAPPWMQRRGLEWAFRLSQEPLRLLPRYLRYNPAFVAAFARQYLRERR